MIFVRTVQLGLNRGALTPKRLNILVFMICALIEIGAFGSNLLLGFGRDFNHAGPTIDSPFLSLKVGFDKLGPKPPKPALERLLETAHRLAQKTAVPYVFGGSQLGSPKRCQECSECIRSNRLPANSTMDRFNICSACRDCGLDCSNFVSHLLTESGLKVKFASTSTLNRERTTSLEEKFGLIDMGEDLELAKPGDLLLKEGHVVVLIDIHHALGTLDFIHASRGSKRTRVGGIELRRGTSIRKMQKEIVRILRHKDLFESEDPRINLTSVRGFLAGIKRMMAEN